VQRKIECLPADGHEVETELVGRGTHPRTHFRLPHRDQRGRLALRARAAGDPAVCRIQVVARNQLAQKSLRAGTFLAFDPADLALKQPFESHPGRPQAWRHQQALLTPKQSHQRPVARLYELPDQRGVALIALVRRTPVNATDVRAPVCEQHQAELAAGRCVADQRPRLQRVGDLRHGTKQQRIVASRDHDTVGQQPAMTRLEQPLIDEIAREQPLAGELRRRDLALAHQRVDFLFVHLQVGSRLLHRHEARLIFAVRFAAGRCSCRVLRFAVCLPGSQIILTLVIALYWQK
jgi:hypothetical protein